MRLLVVVDLVVVKVLHPIVVGVHVAAGVVATTVLFHLFARSIVPRMIGALLTAEDDEAQRCGVGKIACLGVVGIEVGLGAVDVAIGSDVRESGVEGPVLVD